jgi:hypothetical protein
MIPVSDSLYIDKGVIPGTESAIYQGFCHSSSLADSPVIPGHFVN